MDKLKYINLMMEKYQLIFENSPLGICICEQNGTKEVNNTLCEMLGYTHKEMMDIDLEDIVYSEDRSLLKDHFSITNGDQTSTSKHEMRLIKKDKSIIWTEITSRTRFIAENLNTISISIVKDIDEQKRKEEELLEAKRKSEEMAKIKSIFFSNINHELRTPLVGILGFSDILASVLQNENEKSMAISILKSGRRLLNTLTSLMNLAELETIKGNVRLSELDVDQLCKELVNQHQQNLANKEVRIFYKNENEKFKLFTNELLLKEALNQIINNSITYTYKGFIRIKTFYKVIDTETINGVIEIEDTGIGIPKEKQNIIFDEFRQVSEGYSREYEGIGLGLTLSKKSIELLGGKIKLESKENIGTKISISFPVNPKLFSNSTVVFNPTFTSLYKNNVDLSDKKILIVEDDDINCKFLEKCFSNLCDYKIVNNGKDAIESAVKENFDLILMDINLGNGIDGLETVKAIRKIDNYLNIPIVAVTGFVTPDDEMKFLSRGFTHFLPKPFLMKDTVNLVYSILMERKSQMVRMS